MCRSGLRISTSDGAWMSPAVTSAGPADVEAHDDGLVGRRLQHEVLQVEDDVGDVLGDAGDRVELVQRVVEAHRVTAAPGIDDSSVRRSELPSVWPKPGSSGPTANR